MNKERETEKDKKAREYREANGIAPAQTYYHADEHMWRPDYLTVTIVDAP